MQKNKKQYNKATTQSSLYWGLAGIAVLFLFTASFIAPTYANKAIDAVNNTVALGIPRFSEEPFKLGLDLRGGAHLVYKADVSTTPEADKTNALEGARDVIERRVNALGVGEASIRTSKVGDEYRIDVEMPGVTDVGEAIARIGDTPILEFKEINTEPPRVLTAEEEKGIITYNADAKKRATAALARVRKDEDFATVAREVSEDEVSKNNGGDTGFLAKDAVDPVLYDAIGALKDGQIRTTVLDTTSTQYVVKRLGAKDGAQYADVSHILICSKDIAGCSSALSDEEAKAEAERIYGLANSGNFADLAKEYSTDPITASLGGELGEIKQGTLTQFPALETAIFSAESNQIVGPVQTELGYHILYIKNKEVSKEYQAQLIAVEKQTEFDILGPQDPWKFTGLSGKQLSRAEVVTDPQTGAAMVSLKFNDEGTQLFAEITKRNLKQPVAIFLDGELLSDPTVQVEITNGEAVISGVGTIKDAQLLAQRLNAGALPIPVELVSRETIGASLGAESLTQSMKAGLIGLLIVMVLMTLYYRLPGFLATISLALYITLTLAVFKMMGVTMTLSGIAGLILSVGVAMDANVLIFERMKEELQRGRSLKNAMEEGFARAWSSIKDSNISTLITGLLLAWIGTSFVQGFAITLALGVMISMFTAITITRVFLRIVVNYFPAQGHWLFHGYTKKSS
jgi:preprotein translocase subunit SecD